MQGNTGAMLWRGLDRLLKKEKDTCSIVNGISCEFDPLTDKNDIC